MFLVSQFKNGITVNSLPPQVEQEFNLLLNNRQGGGSIPTVTIPTTNPQLIPQQILPPLNSVQQQQQSNWLITPQEKSKYDQILNCLVDNQGYISAPQARQIFSQSGLPENMLAHIWNLSDIQRRGKLNSDEFAVAMHLIYGKLGGKDLPSALPPDLVPPAQRELSRLSDLAKMDALRQEPMRKISPAGSLVGLSSAGLNKNSNSRGNVNIEEDSARKEQLLALVEGKGAEITSLQSQTEILNRKALDLELKFDSLRQDSLQSRRDLLKIGSIPTPSGLSEIDKARFISLKSEMPGLIRKAKETCLARTKQRLDNIKPSAETVSSKAAQLLAERMAAMGVKSSVPVVSQPVVERVEDIEGDGRREMDKIIEIENRFETLSKQLANSMNSIPALTMVVNEKFESGVGIRSARARELFEEIGKLVEPVLDSTVNISSGKMATGFSRDSPFESNVKSVPKVDVESPFGSVRPAVETNPFAAQSSFGNTISNSVPLFQPEVGSGATQNVYNGPASANTNSYSSYVPPEIKSPSLTSLSAPYNYSQSAIKSPGSAIPPDIQGVKKPAPSVPHKKPAPPIPAKYFTGKTEHRPAPVSVPLAKFDTGPKNVASNPFGSVPSQSIKPVSPVQHDSPFAVGSRNEPKPISPAQNLAAGNPFSIPKLDPVVKLASEPIHAPVPTLVPEESSGGPPPPPPPPLNTLDDGTVAPVRLPSTVERESSAGESRPKPKPADVGAQGPNLFALMNAVKEKVESKQIDIPKNDIVEEKSVPGQNSPPKLDLSSTNPFNSSNNMFSAAPVSSTNPFGTPAFANNPFDRAKTTTDESSKSNESGWEMVPKEELYEVVVEFDYNSTGENDMTVVIGNVLKVEQEDDEWILCRSDNGTSGWIPKAFAKRKDIADEGSVYVLDPADESPSVAVEARGDSAEVLFDFEGRNEDEVTVNTGQIVIILSKDDEDWWKINANGMIGFVPKNFLREIFEEGSVRSVPLKEDGDSATNPFGSSAMIFTPSASEFPLAMDDEVEEDFTTRESFSRKEAVQELLTTERSYVDDLMIVQKHFILPLTQFKDIDTLKLFSNFLQIIEINTMILADFEQCMTTGAPIGTAFLKHLDNLQCYKIYCENLDLATSYLQKSRTLDHDLNDFLKKQQNSPACKNLDLSSYLLIPMQRITRYSLLLRQILHYTAKDHPHYDASLISLQMSEEFLEEVNLAIKLKQSISNINRITKTVDLDIPSEDYSLDLRSATRSTGSRLFLHEGIVHKNKSGRKLLLFLFNDILLLTQSKPGPKPYGLYRKPLMLERLTIREAVKTAGKDTGFLDPSCFQIIYDNEVITLRASNVSEKRQWINQVESAKSNLLKSINASSPAEKHSAADTIGTLNVQVFGPQNCFSPGKYRAIFVVGKIKGQILKSKIVDATPANPRINQSLIFTISSLDDKLHLTLYHYDKYSSDSKVIDLTLEYLGEGSVQLDFLEYYAGKETETIKLPLKDGGYESISIKMMYKPT